jgi:PPOX class probable F420-dependent enzyme
MADTLTEQAKDLLRRPVLVSLATLAHDGTPQLTPLWVDVEGDDVVVNTAEGRAKAVNIRRDPHVALCVIDPDDPYNVVVVRGVVSEVTTEGADAHIDALAKKYLGLDEYPMRQPGEVRVKIRIRPERVVMQPSGG